MKLNLFSSVLSGWSGSSPSSETEGRCYKPGRSDIFGRAIFLGDSLLQELESTWGPTLTEPVPEVVEFRPNHYSGDWIIKTDVYVAGLWFLVRFGGDSVADPDVEGRGEGGGGLIYLLCWSFSLLSFLLFYQNKGARSPLGHSPRSGTGIVTVT